MKCVLTCAAGVLLAASGVFASPIDFGTKADGLTPTVNGEAVSGFMVNPLFSISTSGNNLGAAIFDSDPTGPNAGGPDPDLLVGLGNILILQSTTSPAQTTPGIFDVANDSASGGVITFDFVNPVALSTVDLVDIDHGPNPMVVVTLTDTAGLDRTYTVPRNWTFDIDSSGPNGFDTLDLTTLADQVGEAGGVATAVEEAGFNALAVVSIRFQLNGSGGLDNLTFVPTPGAAAMFLVAGLAATRRRR